MSFLPLNWIKTLSTVKYSCFSSFSGTYEDLTPSMWYTMELTPCTLVILRGAARRIHRPPPTRRWSEDEEDEDVAAEEEDLAAVEVALVALVAEETTEPIPPADTALV
jgi:hypothetical protein